MEFGRVFLGLVGWGLRSLPDNKKSLRQIFVEKVDAFLNLPAIAWVLIGFLIIFLLYFVRPMFFDNSQQFSYLVDYIPALDPIGNDLNYNTQSITLWLQGKSPYELAYHLYPPLYHMFLHHTHLRRQKNSLMTGSLAVFGLLFVLSGEKKPHHGVFLFFFSPGFFPTGAV